MSAHASHGTSQRRISRGGLLAVACMITAACTSGGAALPPEPAPFAWPARDVECRGRASNPNACMMRIPGGTFTMGAQSADADAAVFDPLARSDEGPPREVRVGPLLMHRLEVMAWQYRECLHDGGCRVSDTRSDGYYNTLGPGSPAGAPVNGASWEGARRYCAWIGARLPTEAEWEHAARGGEGRRFPWGSARPTCGRAVFGGRSCSDGPSLDPREAGVNAFRVEHLAGNVWEWTADWYDPRWYAEAPKGSSKGPPAGTRRVVRGGGWEDLDAADLRASARASLPPDARLHDVGFRCVRDLPGDQRSPTQ